MSENKRLIDEFDEIDQKLRVLGGVLNLGIQHNDNEWGRKYPQEYAYNLNLMRMMCDYVESIRAGLDDIGHTMLQLKKALY